ncbi:hypothetical protein PINS_up002154 [Pythium insidiosum]|nr:hypothetical protein PINS_up002154 [Pythium insidiosum]
MGATFTSSTVVPIADSRSTTEIVPLDTRYQLTPAAPLPVLNLSISLRSRFLSAKWYHRLRRCASYRKLWLVVHLIGMATAPPVFLAPPVIGTIFAIGPTFLQLPAGLATIAVLRYDVCRLMMRTYDFWFFSIAAGVTCVVVCLQLQGFRGAPLITTWMLLFPDIFIDANLRGVRIKTMVTFLSCILWVIYIGLIRFEVVDDLHQFDLITYKTHRLPADSVMSSGGITVALMLARNVSRAIRAFRQKNRTIEITCLSYRCILKYNRVAASSLLNGLRQGTIGPRAPFIQEMKYLMTTPTIDPELTLVPWMNRMMKRRAVFLLFGCLRFIAPVLSVVGSPVDTWWFYAAPVPIFQSLALLSTVLFCAPCVALYQRAVLRRLVTTFDFLFTSVQTTLVHVSICDFFRWHSGCTVVLLSWLWIHWVLCVDALTPPARQLLGFHIRFAALIFSLCFASSGVIVYLLIFAEGSTQIFDRVLWRARVFGHIIEFRVVPTFYNCLVTVLAWSTRLLYRLWTVENDVLVVVDGVVTYTNYLRLTRVRQYSRL